MKQYKTAVNFILPHTAVYPSPNATRIRWRKVEGEITGERSMHDCDKKNIQNCLKILRDQLRGYY
jgi:hypothetical protein